MLSWPVVLRFEVFQVRPRLVRSGRPVMEVKFPVVDRPVQVKSCQREPAVQLPGLVDGLLRRLRFSSPLSETAEDPDRLETASRSAVDAPFMVPLA